jgi:hypothetical protein
MTNEELVRFVLKWPNWKEDSVQGKEQKECWCVCRSYLSFNNIDRIATCLLCGGVVKDWYPKKILVGDLSKKGRSSEPHGSDKVSGPVNQIDHGATGG